MFIRINYELFFKINETPANMQSFECTVMYKICFNLIFCNSQVFQNFLLIKVFLLIKKFLNVYKDVK